MMWAAFLVAVSFFCLVAYGLSCDVSAWMEHVEEERLLDRLWADDDTDLAESA